MRTDKGTRAATALAVVVALLAATATGAVVSARPPTSSRATSMVTPSSRSTLRTSSPYAGSFRLTAVPTAAAPQAASPVVRGGWDGIDFGSSYLTPPDPILAAGGPYVVEAVNLEMAVYSTQGSLLATYALESFFHSGSDYITDPQVRYDAATGRWFATVADGTTGQILLAVSQSGNPTSGWAVYADPGSPTYDCPDQPILGVGTLNVIMSVNWFSNPCTSSTYTWIGADYFLANKSQLVQGLSTVDGWSSGALVDDVSVHPVKMEGPSAAQYMVATYWPGTQVTSDTLQLFTVTGSPPGTVSVSETRFSMPTAGLAPTVSQAGSYLPLDPGDIRVMDAVWSRGTLWLGFDESCAHPSGQLTSCIRLIQIDTTAPSLVQDFDLTSATRSYFYPGIDLDASGNLAVVFGYSSATDYPGILATGRLAGDPAGVLQPPVLVKAGLGPETTWCGNYVCRYGDYFGAARDTVDGSVVWIAGEYGRGSGQGWGTYIASARIKAMLNLRYAAVGGNASSTGPGIHYVLDGTPTDGVLNTTATVFLADPGSRWSADATFLSPSRDTEYTIASADAGRAAGFANASLSMALNYTVSYRVQVSADSGGAVDYADSAGSGTVPAGAPVSVYVPSGSQLTLTARPSSFLYAFQGWSGNASGSDSSATLTVTGPAAVHAAFAPNWPVVLAVAAALVAAAVAVVFVVSRRRKRAPPAATVPPGPPPGTVPPAPPPAPPAPMPEAPPDVPRP